MKCASRRVNVRRIFLLIAFIVSVSCASTGYEEGRLEVPQSDVPARGGQGDPFGPALSFAGSPYEKVGKSGLFPVHPAQENQIAILRNGDDSFAARIQTLKRADTSVRIQALVFTGDESGLYIAELLKEKKAQGLDVRIIVDAMSNPSVQTQWMYFDLKQHGIEVEGYETFYLQWLNEMPVTVHDAADGTTNPNKRFHEKVWIIDGETDHGVAVAGGLNIANEYFRINPQKPDRYWRDQDVIVKGAVVKDMVVMFERNFDYFIKVKESRGIFNTNIYWDMSRNLLNKIGKVKMNHTTDDQLNHNVIALADKDTGVQFEPAKCRWFQSRPRFEESYIEQAYLKSINNAKREILIANAYFVASDAFIKAVKAAARRCVKVIILTNSPETNDLPMLTIVGREYYDDILVVNSEPNVQACSDGGVQIWEWQGRRKGAAEQTEGTIHAKYAVFDRRVVIVGSYNMDPRSRNLNAESVIAFENESLAGQLAKFFYSNDLDFSKQITMQDTSMFIDSKDAVYQLQRQFGVFIKDAL